MTTPTNEAGHGLPELPDQDVDTERGDYYSMDAMEAYGRACYALALSRGVPADMVPHALVRDLIVGAYNAGTQGVGFTQQLMELPDAPAAAGAQGDVPAMSGEFREVLKATAASIMRDVCETDPADPDSVDTICITTDCLSMIVRRNVLDLMDSTTPQPAAADGGVRERARELSNMIDRFWNLAYAEGKEGRGRDTDSGDAALCRYEIEKRLRALSSHRKAGDGRPHVVRIPKEKRWVEGDSEFLKWHADGYNSALSDVMSVNQGFSRLERSPDLSEFRELAEGWRVEARDMIEIHGSDQTFVCVADALEKMADELLALVEKGGES